MIDAKLPGLDEALDPPSMSQRFGCAVHHAQLVRHKPGKRALVRYDSDNGPLLGKLRAGHRATTPFKLLVHFHDAGFADPAPDDITVPEPVIAIPDLGLWVQRVVPGLSGETAFCDPALPDRRRTLGERAAEAAFKIHRAGVPTRRDHGATDELHILESRLDRVASTHPEHAAALIPVLEGCRRLVGELTVLDRRETISDRFSEGLWSPGLEGLPVLAGSAAHFECASVSRQDAGDHVLIIGRVLSFVEAPVAPLLFQAGHYRMLGEVL